MRIDRLSIDNPRTQGPARRAWYARHNPQHLRGVATVVGRALAASNTPRALGAGEPGGKRGGAVVLGAGACTEIPLARLVRSAGRTVLADLDLAGMEQARQALPVPLRGSVEVALVDLSGGASASLATLLRAQPWGDLARIGSGAVAEAAAACLEKCEIAAPSAVAGKLGHRFHIVLSSLLLTQLFNLPMLDVLDTIGRAHPDGIATAAEHQRYLAAANAFRGRVARSHLDLLAAIVAPGGSVALITDVTGYVTAPTSASGASGGVASRDSLPLFPREAIDLLAEVHARFTPVGSPQRWEWLVSLPTLSQPGRSYAVMGFVLRRTA